MSINGITAVYLGKMCAANTRVPFYDKGWYREHLEHEWAYHILKPD